MNHAQKNSNHPMFVMKQLRHGGCYECCIYYLDMDGYPSTVFSHFHGSRHKDFYSFDDGLNFVHNAKNDRRLVEPTVNQRFDLATLI